MFLHLFMALPGPRLKHHSHITMGFLQHTIAYSLAPYIGDGVYLKKKQKNNLVTTAI